MQVRLFAIFALACLLYASPVSAQTPDHEAVKNTIIEAGETYLREPFSQVALKYWLLDENSNWMVSMADGTFVQFKKDEMLALNDPPVQGHSTMRRDNFQIIVMGDVAYVTSELTAHMIAENIDVYFSELRVLRKTGGVWKIHQASIHQFRR